MNQLSNRKRTKILQTILEGNSIRGTSRLTGANKNTIIKLIVDIGSASKIYQDHKLKNLTLKRLQCDEIWSFCYAKEKNLHYSLRGVEGIGSVWTWTALCPDTKLVPYWHVGRRDADSARWFMLNLKKRISGRVQLTTDGYKPYYEAVPEAFGSNIDFATLVKLYGEPDSGKTAECIGHTKNWVIGRPDDNHISTSLCERQNLTMRQSIRRMARKTPAHSKKLENHIAATDLYFMYYNFVRVHSTLKTTPAVAAGVAAKPWTISQLMNLPIYVKIIQGKITF